MRDMASHVVSTDVIRYISDISLGNKGKSVVEGYEVVPGDERLWDLSSHCPL